MNTSIPIVANAVIFKNNAKMGTKREKTVFSQDAILNFFVVMKYIFMKLNKNKAQQMKLRRNRNKSHKISDCIVTVDFQYGVNSRRCANLSVF